MRTAAKQRVLMYFCVLHVYVFANIMLSGSQTLAVENPRTKWSFLAGKAIDVNSGFSSKPCLISPEGIYVFPYESFSFTRTIYIYIYVLIYLFVYLCAHHILAVF